MAQNRPQEQPAHDQARSGRCFVAGPHQLLNELLAAQLGRHTGEPWSIVGQLDQLPGPSGDSPPGRRVVLWDVQQLPPHRVVNAMELVLHTDRDWIALLNLRRGTALEQDWLAHGIRGFFYQDDGLEWVLRGVDTLLQGQVWLASEALAPPVTTGPLPAPWNLIISVREQEALELIVQGRSNKEIAEAMSISLHTAKTHLYKLYKKINVSSRLEAAIWYRMQAR